MCAVLIVGIWKRSNFASPSSVEIDGLSVTDDHD